MHVACTHRTHCIVCRLGAFPFLRLPNIGVNTFHTFDLVELNFVLFGVGNWRACVRWPGKRAVAVAATAAHRVRKVFDFGPGKS